MLYYKTERGTLFLGSPLPMGDIDASCCGEHAAEAITVTSRFAAEQLLRGMARAFKCPAVIRRTGGGVHAYFLTPLKREEWARVHLQFGGDPLYTRFTMSSRWGLWWDRLSPKPGRAVDDSPSDHYMYAPEGVIPPDEGMQRLWQINCQARRVAFAEGIDAALRLLHSLGVQEIPPGVDRRLPPPPNLIVQRQAP